LQEIADQLRAMKRLWKGQGLDGLLRRRDAEADMVEACIT
jgi:GH24 family phage-related lysozyme (muramidase)